MKGGRPPHSVTLLLSGPSNCKCSWNGLQLAKFTHEQHQ